MSREAERRGESFAEGGSNSCLPKIIHARTSASVAVASASGGTVGGGGGGGGGGGMSGSVGGPLSMSSTVEPRFPPAIAVQRLAPQVQRQLRETQELIKDSCAQLYGSAYGSPGPPTAGPTGGPAATAAAAAAAAAASLRTGGGPGSVLARATARRPTLETQYSQELS
uniref:Uncharacterized protein n=1 Tax=Anopheles farauti TaxID=69004 RepID=A0A182QTT8_9DIPT